MNNNDIRNPPVQLPEDILEITMYSPNATNCSPAQMSQDDYDLNKSTITDEEFINVFLEMTGDPSLQSMSSPTELLTEELISNTLMAFDQTPYNVSTTSEPSSSNSPLLMQISSSDSSSHLTQKLELTCPTPKLIISIQPESTHRFRYESETKDGHGYLCGITSAGRNLKTYTTAMLHLPEKSQALANPTDSKFYIRCTLHEPESGAISPYQLRRRVDGKLKNETELFECLKVSPHIYKFALVDFLVTRLPLDRCQKFCEEKFSMLSDHNRILGSNLKLTMPMAELPEQNKKGAKSKKKLKKPIQVQIGFEAFQLSNNVFRSIAGPIFSHCITDDDPIKIEKICNLCGPKHENTEVTLLVSTLKTLDIQILLKECCAHSQNAWQQVIDLKPHMVHRKAAITFQMPEYCGNQHNAAHIKCEIQLKRLCDGACSNIVPFTYTNGLKRFRMNEDNMLDMTGTPKRSVQSPSSVQSLQVDAVLYNGKEEMNKPKIIMMKFLREREQSLNDGNPNMNIKMLLQSMFALNKASKTGRKEDKFAYTQIIKDYFLNYEHVHPEGNSILHDVLVNDDLQKYEIELYKIIENFNLGDLVNQSRNIYGDTALMYACMYNRPLMVGALINMGTSIDVQDFDTGNNVLHILMEHPHKLQESRVRMMKAIKNQADINSFVNALKCHNLKGLTPLHLAIMHNNMQLAAEILQFCERNKVLDVCSCGRLSDGNTILHLAALEGNTEMHACILKHTGGSLIHVMNYEGYTAAEIIADTKQPLESLVQNMQRVELQ